MSAILHVFVWTTSLNFLHLQEQIEWAVEAKADFMIAETLSDLEEAMCALESIKTYGKGIVGVVFVMDIYHNPKILHDEDSRRSFYITAYAKTHCNSSQSATR